MEKVSGIDFGELGGTPGVLLVDYLGYRILLCADIGENGIEMLLSGNGIPGAVTFTIDKEGIKVSTFL